MSKHAAARFFLACCLFITSSINVAAPLDVSRISGNSDEPLSVSFLYAKSSECAELDFQTIHQCKALKTSEQQTLNLGFQTEPHWFVFSLENSSNKNTEIYVDIGYPLLDDIEFVVLDENYIEIQRFVTGDAKPFSQRPFKHPNFVFPIKLASQEQLNVRVKIETSSSLQVPILIWQPEDFTSSKLGETLLFGLLVGAMIVLAVYNLVLAISIGDKSYFFCATTLCFYALVQSDLLGISYAVLWPNSPEWNQVSVVVFDVLAIASLAIFAQTFLLLKHKSAVTDRSLSIGAFLCVMLVLSIPFVPYFYLIVGTSVLVATIPAIAVVKSALLWREGLVAARYFVFAFLFFVVAVTVYVGSKFGFVPRSLFTENAIHFGALVVVFCLSLAIADQLNHDRKERDKTQSNLINSLKKFQDIYTHSNEGIFSLDNEGKFISANPTFLKILGTPDFDTLVDSFPTIESIVDGDAEDLFQKVKSNEKTLNMDLLCQRIDKTPVWVSCNTRLHRNENGQVVGIEGSIIDISARKAADNELQQTVLRLNEAVKAGRIGIWDWDVKTNEVTFSKEYKAQLGYAENEFGDDFKEWESRVHPEDIQKTLESVQKSVETCSKNHSAVFRIRHRDGHYRWMLTHASVIADENGQPAKMIGTHVDITDRRNLEEELRQSQKMEAIGQLAGGIAHDFNNQLMSIMGFAELLQANLEDSDLSKYVKKIISSAEHSGNLTSQLLTFSRKQNLHLEVVDVHQQLLEVVELLRRSVDKRIHIESILDSEKHEILGDNSLIQNAFLNLGLNARDAMPEGGLISITTSYKDGAEIKSVNKKLLGNAYIKIEFKDTGCGMSDDIRERIFEPFFTTKEVGKGTGMGLASVYGAIEQLSGTISVESEVDAGSCFTIYLPLVEKATNSKIDNSDIVIEKADQSKTILLVDDEALIRELCEDFFTVLGHQGLFAADGAEAIKIYHKNWENIDLVILDMIMPSMSGKEVFKELYKINPGVKVLLASGYIADNSISEMFDLGVTQVISKPFKLSSLGDSIKEATG